MNGDDPEGPRTPRVPAGHSLLLYSTDEHRWRAVATWTRHGLGLGEKVIFAAGAPAPSEAMLATMEEAGIDVDSALRSSQLSFAGLEELYPSGAQEAAVTAALAEGYPGVRVTATADQALTMLSPEEYQVFEARTDDLCRQYPLSALCQYDADAAGRMPETFLRHSVVADDAGIVATRLPDGGSGGAPGPELVADLVGEFDAANARMLEDALTRATRVHDRLERMVLDLSGLRFLSIAAGRALLVATEDFRSHGGTVAIRGAAMHFAQVLALLSLADHEGIELDGTGP